MRRSTNGYRLDFCHLQHAQVAQPLMESIQAIIVGAEDKEPLLRLRSCQKTRSYLQTLRS